MVEIVYKKLVTLHAADAGDTQSLVAKGASVMSGATKVEKRVAEPANPHYKVQRPTEPLQIIPH